jgi:hypothetical protein
MDRNTARAGFQQQRPVGEFANCNTAECSASREDAIAEMEREANVRMKCYDRWVAEGKMTPEEARKRMAGIISAWHYLSDSDQAREALLNAQATQNGA